MNLTPTIPFLLRDSDIARLHERALRLISQIGLKVTEPRLISRLTGKPGLSFIGDRVLIHPEVADAMVDLGKRQRSSVPRQPQTPQRITIMTTHHARHYTDPETGRSRPLTETDAIEAAKLSDSLRDRDVAGGAPGPPQDLPPRLNVIAQYRISLEWSRTGHDVAVSSLNEVRFIREMARVMDQDFGFGLYLISPLRLEGNELEMVLDYLDTCHGSDKPIHVGISSMPTMGLSAPVDPIASFVLGIAENIRGFVLMSLALGQEAYVSFGRINSYPCDFGKAALVVGTPEAVEIEVVRRDFDRFYRHGSFARALRTMSPVPGLQAAAERAAGAVSCALAGYDTFYGGGLLGLDEIFSPVQLVIDCDIRDYALAVARGFSWDEGFDDVGVFREVLEATDEPLPFMTHPITIEKYREVFTPTLLFRRDVYHGQPEPEEDITARAREEIQRRLQTHDYRLDADRLKEINRIYRQAQEELAG